ncbi:zinc finger protein 3 homolog [Cebidichthys violaceus]|uniref:zinc finger protein 3 homolog n=1 Tax=Cebidichthys violaceus TaxID=271503 RepID=UPI0035CA0D24
MSKVQMLRCLVNQRLTAAAEEIFGVFERTIAEYEEELCRSKEENERQRKLLDAVFNPQLRLHRADVQQLLVIKEEVPPEQQDWSSILDQEDQEPEKPQSSPLHQRQTEQMETEANEENCGGPEPDRNSDPDRYPEPDTVQKHLVVKEEVPPEQQDWSSILDQVDQEPEKPQSSQLHQRQTEQMETEADEENCGGPEPDRNSDPDRHPEPDTVQIHLVVKEEVPSEQQEWSSNLDQEDPEPPHIKEDQEDPEPPHIKEEQEELRTSQAGEQLQGLMETEGDGEDCGGPEPDRNSNPDRHPEPDTFDKTGDSSESETDDSDDWKETREPQSGLNSLNNEGSVSDSRCQAGEKPFGCSECDRRYTFERGLKRHMLNHSRRKRFGCSECDERFTSKPNLKRHMRAHTREKPFSCSVCRRLFAQSADLQIHMRIHTGEKRLRCSACDQRFSWLYQLRNHECVGQQSGLNSLNNDDVSVRDSTCSAGEKPFSCSTCEKKFGNSGHLKRHENSHKRETIQLPSVKKHKRSVRC